MQDRRPPALQNLLATHGRTIHQGHTRPFHEVGQVSGFTSGKPGMPSAGFARPIPTAPAVADFRTGHLPSGHVNRATKTGDQCKAERIAIVVPRISADLAPLKTLLPVPPFPAYLCRAEFPA